MKRGRNARKKNPVPIARVMGRLLDELGLDDARAVFELAQRWEEAVGTDIARHCKPVGVRQGVLETTVDSSVWAQQLQLRRPEILAKLRETLGEDAPKDLRFRVGRV